jgi:hypothetical protein
MLVDISNRYRLPDRWIEDRLDWQGRWYAIAYHLFKADGIFFLDGESRLYDNLTGQLFFPGTMQYILITYYNRGTSEKPIWEVYGHRSPYDNDLIASFENKQDAYLEAHRYELPVMQGVSNSMRIARAISILSASRQDKPSRG